MVANLSLLLKVAARQRTGRYVVAQCCHYQCSVAAVLENAVYDCFRPEIPHDRNYPELPYTGDAS